MWPQFYVCLITEQDCVPLILCPVTIAIGKTHFLAGVLSGESILPPCHTTEETCFIESTTNGMYRDRQLQFSLDLLRRDELLLDCCSDDVDISILICLPLTSRSTLVFHRAMLLIMDYPVTNSLETARNLARYLGSLLSIFVQINDGPSLLRRQRIEERGVLLE
jgi:hypothetical protein